MENTEFQQFHEREAATWRARDDLVSLRRRAGMVLLVSLYPGFTLVRLVGSDIAHAVP